MKFLAFILMCTPLIAKADWVDNFLSSKRFQQYAPYKSCIVNSSKWHDIPVELTIAVLTTENCGVKQSVGNTNKTRDYGPMCINDVRMPELSKELKFTRHHVVNDACANIFAATHLLRKEILKAKNFWRGVGNYHSKTPKYHNRYVAKVIDNWPRFSK